MTRHTPTARHLQLAINNGDTNFIKTQRPSLLLMLVVSNAFNQAVPRQKFNSNFWAPEIQDRSRS